MGWAIFLTTGLGEVRRGAMGVCVRGGKGEELRVGEGIWIDGWM